MILGGEVFQSALTFSSPEQFAAQLSSQSINIKQAISALFERIPTASPDLRILQEQLASALAKEKAILVESQQLNVEKEQLTGRLEAASWRYMKAERALDRAKSAQVQKLERQAYANANGDASSPTVNQKTSTPTRPDSEPNGELENGVASAEAEAARQEAVAVAESRMKQVGELEMENARLTNELSAARTKVASLSDDDYAETSLFKSIRSQFEDVIKRVNDLEATNIQLREEAQKLQQERTSYRLQVDEEIRGQTSETEAGIARCEYDLARIRTSRDELVAEISVRKAAEDNRRTAADQARELAEARDQKIKSLESELGRARLQLGEVASEAAADDLDNLDADGLRAKLRDLQQQHTLLSQELPSIEDAWRKAQALASKKVADAAEIEDKVARLSAEKTKADQKYFAAMKAKDAREAELRVLRAKDLRSAEIVTQLKDADARTRELIIGMERQLAEAKTVLTTTEQQYRAAEQKQLDASTQLAALKTQITDFKSAVSTKDEELLTTKKAHRDTEAALEGIKARLEESKKQLEGLRKSKSAQSGTDADDWRVSLISFTNTRLNADDDDRDSLSALCATPTSATPLSSCVDTYSASRVSIHLLQTEAENVQAAARPLA